MNNLNIELKNIKHSETPLPIKLNRTEATFLCSWDNEIVEIHTAATLENEYADTNLFFDEDDDDGTVWNLNTAFSHAYSNGKDSFDCNEYFIFKDLLTELSMYDENINMQIHYDNMMIQRIK